MFDIGLRYSKKKNFPDVKYLKRDPIGIGNVRCINAMFKDPEKTSNIIADKKNKKARSCNSCNTRREKTVEEKVLAEQKMKNITARETKQVRCTVWKQGRYRKTNSSSCPTSGRENDHRRTISIEYETCNDDVLQAFVNQKFVAGTSFNNEETCQQSKHFMDVLGILNSNKELFVKLLDDPNSLLAKHIEDLKKSQAGKQHVKHVSEDRSSIQSANNASQYGGPKHTEKSKSLDKYPARETAHSHRLDSTLGKPDSTSTQRAVDKASRGYFSFRRIKKKLSKALKLKKKNPQGMSTENVSHKSSAAQWGLESCNGIGEETMAQITPYELITGTRLSKASLGVTSSPATTWLKDFQWDVGHEADLTWQKNDRDTSYQMHDGDKDHGVITRHPVPVMSGDANKQEDISQKRDFNSTRILRNYQMANDPSWMLGKERSQWSDQMKINGETSSWTGNNQPGDQSKALHAKSKQLDNRSSNTNVDRGICSSKKDPILEGPQGLLNENEQPPSQSKSHINFPAETDTPGVDNLVSSNSTDTSNVCKDVNSEPLESDLLVQPTTTLVVCPPSAVTVNSVEELYLRKDATERPSPVSVLERNFTENEIKHASRASQPAIPFELLLNRINRQEGNSALVGMYQYLSRLSASADGASKFVKAILHFYSLNWDEISRRRHMPGELLDQSLSSETNSCHRQLSIEQRLLFDLTHEVLLQICHIHIRRYPWLSFVVQNVRPSGVGKDLTTEVTKQVNRHLQQKPQPLEQLVSKDLDNSANWIDIHTNLENIVIEMVGSILEELIFETLFN